MAASSWCLRVSGGVPASAESGRTAQAGIDAENATEPADDSTLRDELPALGLPFGHLPGRAARFIDQRSCRAK